MVRGLSGMTRFRPVCGARVEAVWLGLVDYATAYETQKRVHAEVASGERPPTLLLLEHPPTVTLGQRGDPAHLLVHETALARRGIAVHRIERGGQATYHGPGQLVGYPIVPVEKVGNYLRAIENVLLRVVAGYGVVARGNPGYAGIWAVRPDGVEAKLAAIGIAVRRRVAFHGFALNVSTRLEDYSVIVPCGQPGQPVTSLKQLTGSPPELEQVADRVADEFLAEWKLFHAQDGDSAG